MNGQERAGEKRKKGQTRRAVVLSALGLVGFAGPAAAKIDDRNPLDIKPSAPQTPEFEIEVEKVEQPTSPEFQERAQALFNNFFQTNAEFRSAKAKVRIQGSFMEAVDVSGSTIKAFDMRIIMPWQGGEKDIGIITFQDLSKEEWLALTPEQIVEKFGEIFDENLATILKEENIK